MNDWRATVREVLALQGDEDMKTDPGPSIQWYPGQWLGDPAVQLMDWPAKGLHHHLLMVAWKGWAIDGDPIPCSLPGDDEVLCALCNHPAEWPSLWRQIGRAWKPFEGRFWNLGLCRSYLAQMETRRKRKAAADARWQHQHSTRNANASNGTPNASGGGADASVVQCSSSSSSSSATPREEERESARAKAELSGDLETARKALELLSDDASRLWSPKDVQIAREWAKMYRAAGLDFEAIRSDLAALSERGETAEGPPYVGAILRKHRDRNELGKLAELQRAVQRPPQQRRGIVVPPADAATRARRAARANVGR